MADELVHCVEKGGWYPIIIFSLLRIFHTIIIIIIIVILLVVRFSHKL